MIKQGKAILFTLILSALFSPSLTIANDKNSSAILSSSNVEVLADSINKSPNDKADYRVIRLPNKMEVLLISDEKANKSLMSLALPIGSMEDPILQQGLAHYLEHMVLMGSKNYPQTNSLDQFLTQNGGYNNASTTPMRTIYYFQVNNNAFDEAAMRFADTLSAPLLLPENAKKELNAVNAEMVRAKSNDGHLMARVNLATSNPNHPITKFTVGNLETLSDKPNSILQTELEKFYHTYYSANIMKAVLYSNRSLDNLSDLALKTLGKVENKEFISQEINEPLYREQDKGVMIYYQPIRPFKMLLLSFDLPNFQDKFKEKTGSYLSYLFNNNTEGTLSDYLIKNGLSDSGLSVSYEPNVGRNRGSFSFYVALTDKGLKEKDSIISLIFQKIALVKEKGIDVRYFSELKEVLSQEFRHLEVEKNSDYIEGLAEIMLYYPTQHILDHDFITTEFNQADILAKLSVMTPDNVRIMILGDDQKTELKTPYFKAGYALRTIRPEEKQQWLDFSKNPEIVLPELNPYIATDFSLTKNVARKHPELIANEKGTKLYVMQSHYFPNDPKVRISLNLSASSRIDNLKNSLAASLLNYMFALSQAKISNQAEIAGISLNTNIYENAISVQAEGFSQHLADLMLDNLKLLRDFELTDAFLSQAKDRYAESLIHLEKAGSLAQANAALASFSTYPYFDVQSRREMLPLVTLADIRELRDRLVNQISGLKMLSVGNFSDQAVHLLRENVKTIIPYHNDKFNKRRYLDIAPVSRKLNYITKVPHQDNALSVTYFANHYNEIEGLASSMLLRDIISRWYFDDLRTNKQLGYIVSNNIARVGKVYGMSFMVQSPNASPKQIMAHNQRFFLETKNKLAELSQADFMKYRDSLLEKLRNKPESLSQEFDQYVRDFYRDNIKFDRNNILIDAVEKLSLQNMIDFYRNTVLDETGMVFISQALGSQIDEKEAWLPENFERITSIEALQKEFNLTENE